jgi:hypothetical protein
MRKALDIDYRTRSRCMRLVALVVISGALSIALETLAAEGGDVGHE